MKKIELTKIASFLYHNDHKNPARFEIYQVIDHKHPQAEIQHDFSPETEKVIQDTAKTLEAAKIKREKELKKLKKKRK